MSQNPQKVVAECESARESSSRYQVQNRYQRLGQVFECGTAVPDPQHTERGDVSLNHPQGIRGSLEDRELPGSMTQD